MYTDRKDINKIAEGFLDGLTLEEVIAKTRTSHENKNNILEKLLKDAESNGNKLIEGENLSLTYDMLFKAIKIYRRKCYELAGVLRSVCFSEKVPSEFVTYFDLQIVGDKVLTRDVNRLLIPLKTNLKLLSDAIEKLQDIESYVIVDNRLLKGKKLPRASLFNTPRNSSDEFVELTQGNIERIKERRNRAKEIVSAKMNMDI